MSVPLPEVPARIAEPHEIPKTATGIAKLAETHGWQVQITYARGTWMAVEHHAKVVDSIAVRMQRGSQRAVATWHDGKFHNAMTERLEIGLLNTREIRAHLIKESE